MNVGGAEAEMTAGRPHSDTLRRLEHNGLIDRRVVTMSPIAVELSAAHRRFDDADQGNAG